MKNNNKKNLQKEQQGMNLVSAPSELGEDKKRIKNH